VSFGLPPAYKRQREAHELQKEAETMTQFHEGQEVEVATTALESRGGRAYTRKWRKARIDYRNCIAIEGPLPRKEKWHVIFADGTRGVFDEDHIRIDPLQATRDAIERSMLREPGCVKDVPWPRGE
jgi:hypothetical protein